MSGGTEELVMADQAIVGRVEAFDLDQGITGWAFDPRDRRASLDLELLAGDLLLAVVGTDRYRGDLGSGDDPDFNPGFVFSGATLRRAALNPAADLDSELSVRFAGRVGLEGIQLPTIRVLREAVEAEGLPDRDTFGLDLRRALATLTDDASVLRRRPIRPIAANLRGYIEAVAPIDRQLTAFSGWCHRGTEMEGSAVLLDGEKHAAAYSVATYDRADLPGDAQAFVGVLHTAWHPRPRGSEPFLFFGPSGEFHFRSAATLKPGSVAAMEGTLGHIAAGGLQHRLMELRQLLLTHEGWSVRGDKGAGLGLALSLDRVLLVPGFGALVEGWVLAGARRLSGMTLRVGSKVLHLDPSTMRRIAREDLVKGYPAFRDVAHAAGFTGFFLGPLDETDLLDPMVKAQFTDGASLAVEVNPALLRHFDATCDADGLERPFPALAMEPLFPGLAAARSSLMRKQVLASAQPVIRVEADRVLLLVLPPSANDLNLVLDGVSRHLGKLPPGVAVGLIADHQQNRDAILRGVAAARARNPGAAVSVTMVQVVDHALFAVPAILQFHRAERFVFAGAEAWLTPEGWSHAAALLGAPDGFADDRITFLPVATEAGGTVEADHQVFGWSRRALNAWIRDAVAPFDEAAPRRGLPAGSLVEGGAAAIRLRRAGRSAYKAQLDAVLFPTGMVEA